MEYYSASFPQTLSHRHVDTLSERFQKITDKKLS